MILRRNHSVYGYINEIHLQLSNFGYAVGKTEWAAKNAPDNMVYSRLWYIISGDPYIISNGSKIYLKPGNCYLLPTGYPFGYSCDSSIEQLYFHINLNDMCGMDILRNLSQIIEYTPSLEDVEMMKKCVESELVTDSLILKELLYKTLNVIFKKYDIQPTVMRYSAPVFHAISYIQSNLSAQMKVSNVAANAFTSVSTLSHQFKKETGMTIKNFINRALMFEVELLIRQTNLPINEIGDRLGFSDKSYFSRKFKSIYGLSPQEYRKQKPF